MTVPEQVLVNVADLRTVTESWSTTMGITSPEVSSAYVRLARAIPEPQDEAIHREGLT